MFNQLDAGEGSCSMEFKLFVGNLSKSTTQEELQSLFELAGEITAIDLYRDRKTGESNGFAFISMSTQNEADKAIGMFDRFLLSEHSIKVNLVQSRERYAWRDSRVEP
jgi:RNA recognition motif-containing protein